MPRARGVRRRARGAAVEFMARRISDAANIPRGSVTPLQRGVVALRPTGAHDEPAPPGGWVTSQNASQPGRRMLKSARRFLFLLTYSVLPTIENQSIAKKVEKMFDMRWGREYPTGKGVLCTPCHFLLTLNTKIHKP